jgi:hypothetical protein
MAAMKALHNRMISPIHWPDGKRFAFTVFDDTDSATLENVRNVYALLGDLGFRTTKSCWVVHGDPKLGKFPGDTCDRPEYLQWLLELQAKGFEIGWHGPTWHGLPRAETIAALDRFAQLFGHNPITAANHTGSPVGLYWAESRLSGILSGLYRMITLGRNEGLYRGHIPGDDSFWGDICKERITYYRNFVFQDINTLKACPFMPYYDPDRPLVNYWFASSNGRDVQTFNRCLAEKNQDRLEEEGGLCIMYAHFAYGFADGGCVNPTFQSLMRRLAAKGGWYVPVNVVLDLLRDAHGRHVITSAERGHLERKWFCEKIRVGTV